MFCRVLAWYGPVQYDLRVSKSVGMSGRCGDHWTRNEAQISTRRSRHSIRRVPPAVVGGRQCGFETCNLLPCSPAAFSLAKPSACIVMVLFGSRPRSTRTRRQREEVGPLKRDICSDKRYERTFLLAIWNELAIAQYLLGFPVMFC